MVKPRSIPRRERIYRRDGYRCVYCGTICPAEELTLDHVEPRTRGGDQSDGNLVTCCEACNRSKAGQPAWSYLARRPEARAHFLAATAPTDSPHAGSVWPRLRRAVMEAADKQ